MRDYYEFPIHKVTKTIMTMIAWDFKGPTVISLNVVYYKTLIHNLDLKIKILYRFQHFYKDASIPYVVLRILPILKLS